jgi:hypothetical protein
MHDWEKKVADHFALLTPISRQLSSAKEENCQDLVSLLSEHLEFATDQLRTVRQWTQQARAVTEGGSQYTVDKVQELIESGKGKRFLVLDGIF